MTEVTDQIISRIDKVSLQTTIYKPHAYKAAIFIAPATGIKRQFYNSFASFLAENDYGVITFDNEGIGGSLNGQLKHSKASIDSWGAKDMSAVYQQLKHTFPNTTYHLVGHSAGGQIVGLMEGALELSSIFNFACSSGSIRTMNYPFKVQAHLFMNGFIPISNLLLGYTNSPIMGMGQPLPRKVAQQWREWCNSTGYIQDFLNTTKPVNSFQELNCPSMWLHATDDDIATLTNVKDMIRVFPQLHAEIKSLDPSQYAFKDIGHMKFFSKKRKDLWPLAIDWFRQFN